MSNRDRYGGLLKQHRGSVRLHNPSTRDRTDAVTQPRRRDNSANPPGSDRETTPIVTPTTPAAPAPLRRQRVPGGAALDILDDQERPPTRTMPGWRELLSRIPGINLGPGKDQAYELRLRDRVRRPVETVFPVVVFNLKGGVGTTTVVEALGSTFADVRGGRVIAVDLDSRDLADKHGRRNPLGMFDLVADGAVTEYLDVRAHTYLNTSGLEVLGVGDDTHESRQVERGDFAKVFERLRHHYSVVLTDAGNTLKSGVLPAALRRSSAVVVVSSASVDALQRTRTTLGWLRTNGYQRLLGSMVLAINHIEAGKPDAAANSELAKISRQFPKARVIALPFDPHLAEGRGIILERLSKESRRRYLEMAAALAELFPAGAAATQR
ncbi:MAG TPA: MinD/ParA family protein [Mycobacterium sp.]|nr:MinD/ParA family protein [Mycobacterium sp.]